MTKFLNISTDNTLGGNSPSNEIVSSQKAIKEYVDSQGGGGGSAAIDNSTITRNSSLELQTVGMVNANSSSSLTPLSLWTGTNTQWEQGASLTWYNWLPVKSWQGIYPNNGVGDINNSASAYGNGKFVTIGRSSSTAYYSTDGGSTWSSGSLSVSSSWRSIAYGNGIFVAVSDAAKCVYSSDGINWSAGGDLVSSGDWHVAFGNNIFVAVALNNGKVAYSTDGISWTVNTASNITRYCITFDGSKFIAGGNDYISYSTDGINWTDFEISGGWYTIACGDGKYVSFSSTGYYATSTDGMTWVNSGNRLVSNICWVAYGNGDFNVVSMQGNGKSYYSSDGVTWSERSINNVVFSNIVFGEDTFVALPSAGNLYVCKMPYPTGSYFTIDQNPTTSSVLYDNPNEESELTITSASGSTITLSNSVTCGYNSSGNQVSYTTIGSLHPNWICNINNVGVKVGNTVIADNTAKDNLSITENSSNQIQTIGVINQNATTTAIKTWTGTRSQYDAILSKDANTLYNITDDTDVTLTILEALYPVGSVYITTSNTCPLSTLIAGSTWTLVSSGVVTSVAGSSSAPVKGNGLTLGLTNGTKNTAPFCAGGSYYGGFGESNYGQQVSASYNATVITGRLGVTTDASNSGIIADISNSITATNLSVNIFERTA